MNPLNETFKALRIKHRYSKKGLGDKLGKSGLTVTRLEEGITQIQIEDVTKLAEVLNMPFVNVLMWPEKWINEKEAKAYPVDHPPPEQLNKGYGSCEICKQKDLLIEALQNNLSDLRKKQNVSNNESKDMRDVG